MFNKIKYLLFTLTITIFSFVNAASDAPKIVGYYPNWAIYRNPTFYPKDIDASLLTHINYAFVKLSVNGELVLFDPWADIQYGENWQYKQSYWGNFYQLKQLKEKHPHLKTLASIGGWTLSDTFSAVAKNPVTRQQFVKSCVKFCETYGFDGVDIDWEYPGFAAHQGAPEDKENFTLLLAELHQAAKAHQPPLLVTIAAPAGPWHYKNMEVDQIHHYLDWINLMGYDFHGPWSGGDDAVTNHLAPLYPTKEGHHLLNVDAAVTYYLEQGVPPQKLVLGVPFYGRSYSQVSSEADGLYANYKGPGSGTTEEVGMRFFYDIKKNLLPHYTYFWDDQTMTPYLYNPSKKEFISYDDEISIGLKTHYVKDRSLGGVMVWELGLDTRPEWDLLKTIHSILIIKK